MHILFPTYGEPAGPWMFSVLPSPDIMADAETEFLRKLH